jgi:hypothetical protein
MSLSITDGTQQKTLDIISSKVGGIPIKYARIFSRYVTRDNHPGGAFTANLACYVVDNPTPEQTTPLHYEFGCTLQASAITAMAGTDDRDILYRHIEYIVQFQDAQERQNDEGFDIAAEQAALDSLRDSLGIETLFTLSA